MKVKSRRRSNVLDFQHVSNFCDVCSVRSANMRMMGGDSGPTSISGDNQEEDEARNLHSVSSADTHKKVGRFTG